MFEIGPYTISEAPHGKKEIWITDDPSKRVKLLPYQLHQFLKQAGYAIRAGKTPPLPDVR